VLCFDTSLVECFLHFRQRLEAAAASSVEKSRRAGSCNFPTEFQQTAANFRQRKLLVLKISILPLNIPKIVVFHRQLLHFLTKILQQEEDFPTISDSPKFRGGRTIAPVP